MNYKLQGNFFLVSGCLWQYNHNHINSIHSVLTLRIFPTKHAGEKCQATGSIIKHLPFTLTSHNCKCQCSQGYSTSERHRFFCFYVFMFFFFSFQYITVYHSETFMVLNPVFISWIWNIQTLFCALLVKLSPEITRKTAKNFSRQNVGNPKLLIRNFNKETSSENNWHL